MIAPLAAGIVTTARWGATIAMTGVWGAGIVTTEPLDAGIAMTGWDETAMTAHKDDERIEMIGVIRISTTG